MDSPPLHAVSSALGYAHALSGRSADAIPLLEEAVKRPVFLGATQEGQSLRTVWLSEAYLLTGREADARAAAASVSLGSTKREDTRRTLFGSSARSRRAKIPLILARWKTTIAELSPSPKHSVCALSSLTAI